MEYNEKQKQHLNNVNKHLENVTKNSKPCLHDSCSECVGTGIKKDGAPCIHYISCPCRKCSPCYL